jgi:MoaA/NifB/PqqE/SkfB family radical SAM enzyme
MFLMNLTIETELCNLRCKYCWLTIGNETTTRTQNRLITRVINKESTVITSDSLVTEVAHQVEKVLEAGEAKILKVSGGEIFLLPEVLESVQKFSKKYEKIQILTNATKIDEDLLKKLDPTKFAFQVSLDGYTETANYARFGGKSYELTQRVLTSVRNLFQLGFNVEINAVITPQNINELPSYAKFMQHEFPYITIFPFPVRFSEAEFQLTGSQEVIEQLIEDCSDFKGTLPPQGYLTALHEMMKYGKQIKCYLPLLTLSSDELGNVSVCPCGNLGSRGNILDGLIGDIQLTLGDQNVKDILNWKHSKCRECFTHFDVINLFLAGKVDEDDLSYCGIFQDANILKAIVRYKEKILA